MSVSVKRGEAQSEKAKKRAEREKKTDSRERRDGINRNHIHMNKHEDYITSDDRYFVVVFILLSFGRCGSKIEQPEPMRLCAATNHCAPPSMLPVHRTRCALFIDAAIACRRAFPPATEMPASIPARTAIDWTAQSLPWNGAANKSSGHQSSWRMGGQNSSVSQATEASDSRRGQSCLSLVMHSGTCSRHSARVARVASSCFKTHVLVALGR